MRDKSMSTADDGQSIELLAKFSEVLERVTVPSIYPSLAPVAPVKQIALRPPTAEALFVFFNQ